MTGVGAGDAGAVLAALTDDAGPYLIGVRHHAPSLAAAMPALLDEARPDVLLVELPAEMQDWLPWLAHEDTVAPVALAAVEEWGTAFYPFADFSPELVALRWAARRGVRAVACDLPLADRSWEERTQASRQPGQERPGLEAALRAGITGRAGEDLWDRLVEAPAPGSTPRALRRAALLTGWALRRDAEAGPGVDALDLAREAWMRGRLREAARGGQRVAAVVGAFHAGALTGADAALSGDADTVVAEPVNGGADDRRSTVSLIPYTYALLDERSAYPAGIRDPAWQQLVLEAGGRAAALDEALVRTAVRICGEVRAQDQPSGPADAREIARLAGDLARLRGLPAAGRGEVVEAVQTVLAQGEPLGRGRAVARAMERVMVGERHGRAAPGAPRSGLAPAVEAELAAVRLPGPERPGAERQVRLDPLRTALDREREVLLRRLVCCGIPYGVEQAVIGAGGADALSTRWTVCWTPATAAMLVAAGSRGVTSAQAAEGALRERWRAVRGDGGLTAGQAVDLLGQAAACGLPALAAEVLGEAEGVLQAAGTLPELLAGLALLDRLRSGHVAGLPDAGAVLGRRRLDACVDALTSAAVRQVDGLAGSDAPEDARALLELAHRADAFGGVRLADALIRLAATGSPLMRGAAGAVCVLLGLEDAAGFGARVASWVDAATTPDAREELTARLTGLLTAAGRLLESSPTALRPLLDRVAGLPDRPFLDRLPALRGGFDTLSPAARDRLLAEVEDRLGEAVPDPQATDPATLAAWTAADLAAREALIEAELLDAAGAESTFGAGTGDPGGTDEPLDGAESRRDGERAGRAPAPRDDAESRRDGEQIGPAPVPLDGLGSRRDEENAGRDGAQRDGVLVPLAADTPLVIAAADRWRLLLGRGKRQLAPRTAALATALDELYGSGRGEGSRGDLDGAGPGRRGGREPAYPGVREWAEQLTALFGPGIREEVLAAAAACGRQDAVFALDADSVRPSVELLRTVLQHAGGLPEARLAALRPLVRRLVDELTRRLATRMRPALTGLARPRPTSRPGGGLDLARTVRANLATARRGPDGAVRVIPERPVFHSKARRSADWRLIVVTDVSGSMEASTVWSALTASILAGVPALSTHFLAFSTEVMDLTDRVADPLALLLEVRVGGGTHIAAGLRHARTLVTAPSRTLVVVVSDFEEGYPLGGLLAEVRELVGAGCHLLGCASLDDAGRPRYATGVAGQLVAAGMPIAALSPVELARWVGEKVG